MSPDVLLGSNSSRYFRLEGELTRATERIQRDKAKLERADERMDSMRDSRKKLEQAEEKIASLQRANENLKSDVQK